MDGHFCWRNFDESNNFKILARRSNLGWRRSNSLRPPREKDGTDFNHPATTLSQEDRDALWRAKQVLESPSLTMKLTGMLGAPVEKMIARLPDFATGKINDATQLALRSA